MEEQIITVHVPKDQYRKFAKLAGQVNVPMQNDPISVCFRLCK